MILVLSYDWYEQGTDPVINWLIFHKAPFVKVTIQDLLNRTNNCRIDVNKGKIWINGVEFASKINVIWFRRFEDDLRLGLKDEFPSSQAAFELKYEFKDLLEYFYKVFDHKIWMPRHDGYNLNKLETLYFANKLNVKVPETIVCNNKSDLKSFYNKHNKEVIIKPMRHSGYFIDEEKTYSIYTNSITDDFIKALPNNFLATLVQQKVKGLHEIRTFYLDGEFYSTAVWVSKPNSHSDIKLNYSSKHINWFPYEFPKELREQYDNFFRKLNLNTCSFDVIKTNDGQYVLLEINSVGQYSAPGNRCNYNLDEKIASWLINKNEDEEKNKYIQKTRTREIATHL